MPCTMARCSWASAERSCVGIGVKRENVWLCDIHGLVYEGRAEEMNPEKAAYAQKSDLRTLEAWRSGVPVVSGSRFCSET